jgi:hypothetical protein
MLNIDWRDCLCPVLMARNFISHYKLNILWWQVPPFTVTVTFLAPTHHMIMKEFIFEVWISVEQTLMSLMMESWEWWLADNTCGWT